MEGGCGKNGQDFRSFDFYNAVLPFPVAEKVWKRDWRLGLIGAKPHVF